MARPARQLPALARISFDVAYPTGDPSAWSSSVRLGGRIWPEHDPVFPRAWSDRLDDFFANVRLQYVDGVGHFTPLECPRDFAAALAAAAGTSPSI
jgi:pimeloyl-ACP methyl ester carboxylesterase